MSKKNSTGAIRKGSDSKVCRSEPNLQNRTRSLSRPRRHSGGKHWFCAEAENVENEKEWQSQHRVWKKYTNEGVPTLQQTGAGAAYLSEVPPQNKSCKDQRPSQSLGKDVKKMPTSKTVGYRAPKHLSLHIPEQSGNRKSNTIKLISENLSRDCVTKQSSGKLVNTIPLKSKMGLAEKDETTPRNSTSSDQTNICIIVKMLAKLCEGGVTDTKAAYLMQACSAQFLEQLLQYLQNLSPSSERSRDFIDNLLTFLLGISTIMPISISLIIKLIYTHARKVVKVIDNQLGTSYRNLGDKCKAMDVFLKVYFGTIEAVIPQFLLQDLEPTRCVDYRNLNILPSPQDIFKKIPLVVEQKCDTRFSTMQEYLAHLFNSIRDSFTSQLSQGLATHIDRTKFQVGRIVTQLTNTRYYTHVVLVHPKVVSGKLCVVVNFDVQNKLEHIRNDPARFQLGTLLCLIPEQYRLTVYAVVVANNRVQEGLVLAELCSLVSNEAMFTETYSMFETQVFASEYLPLMETLQVTSDASYVISNYMVNKDLAGNPPLYLMNQRNVGYSLMNQSKTCIPILNKMAWPSAAKFGLDDAQFEAFKSALTKDLTLIKGPPGSGKTTLAARVTEVLVNNASIWMGDAQQPILVLTKTHEALAHLVEKLSPDVEGIVTIAKVSQENMSPMVQNSLVFRRRAFPVKGQELIITKMKTILLEMKMLEMDMEVLRKNEGILTIEGLRHYGIISKMNNVSFHCPPHHPRDIFYAWLCTEDSFLDDIHKKHSVLAWNMEEKPYDVQDLGFDLGPDYGKASPRLRHVETIANLEVSRTKLREKIRRLQEQWKGEDDVRRRTVDLNIEYAEIARAAKYLELQLSKLGRVCFEETTMQTLEQDDDLWTLPAKKRWLLYGTWVRLLFNRIWFAYKMSIGELRKLTAKYEKAVESRDLKIVTQAQVVGITVQQAFEHRCLLRRMEPRIVIVEEADRILETEMMALLPVGCQHLILIGDAKIKDKSMQEKHYYPGISLYKRLETIGLKSVALTVQYRMCPEIAHAVLPLFYQKLKFTFMDNPLPIKESLDKLLLINHSGPEKVFDETSFLNVDEANLMVTMCEQLLFEGCEAEDITILTLEPAQLAFMSLVFEKKMSGKAIQQSLVQDFQGKESRVVFLSLVRSNKAGEIGRLGDRALVCSALTRARECLYIVGNFEMLRKDKLFWANVDKALHNHHVTVGHLALPN